MGKITRCMRGGMQGTVRDIPYLFVLVSMSRGGNGTLNHIWREGSFRSGWSIHKIGNWGTVRVSVELTVPLIVIWIAQSLYFGLQHHLPATPLRDCSKLLAISKSGVKASRRRHAIKKEEIALELWKCDESNETTFSKLQLEVLWLRPWICLRSQILTLFETYDGSDSESRSRKKWIRNGCRGVMIPSPYPNPDLDS